MVSKHYEPTQEYNPDVPVWEKQEWESAAQFNGFVAYRELGRFGRNRVKAYRIFKDNPDLKQASGQFSVWMQANDWEYRVRAWDREQIKEEGCRVQEKKEHILVDALEGLHVGVLRTIEKIQSSDKLGEIAFATQGLSRTVKDLTPKVVEQDNKPSVGNKEPYEDPWLYKKEGEGTQAKEVPDA